MTNSFMDYLFLALLQAVDWFRWIQRGVRRAPRRERAAPRGEGAVPTARGKRVDTYGFYPLNSRFPLFPSLAQITDM